jgi:hypothetical protein
MNRVAQGPGYWNAPGPIEDRPPDDSTSLRMFARLVGPQALPRLMEAGHGVLRKAQAAVDANRRNREQAIREYGLSARHHGSWRAAESSIAEFDLFRPPLTGRVDQCTAALEALVPALARRLAQLVTEHGGLDMLARGVYLAEHPEDVAAPARQDKTLWRLENQLRAARERVEDLRANGTISGREYAKLVADAEAEPKAALDRYDSTLGAKSSADHGRYIAAMAGATAKELTPITTGDVGAWARITLAAEKLPEAFPDGFLDRWLDATADAACESGAAVFLDTA